MRRITSLTAFLTFFVILVTSIALYIAPQGRVAYWADWRLLYLSKEQWGAVHINVGLLFLLSLSLHIYYNWRPIVLYLRNKSKMLRIFTKELNIALILTVVCITGAYFEIPPFSTIISISDHFKKTAAAKYGEPPYGHAELSSMKTFAEKTGIDLDAGIRLLKQAGYDVGSEKQTLLEIAKHYGVSPQQIYLIMKPASDKSSGFPGIKTVLPETPVQGMGKLTLADFCSQYDLDIEMILTSLKESGMILEKDMTIKHIAEINQKNPTDVYDLIQSVVEK
jgi:hypothetical protein